MALGPASGIDLSICTITTQEWKDLEPCLRSLAENLLKERSVEVVIVNNCSTDTDYGVLEELRRVFPIHVIENTERLNFGANNNLALRAARGNKSEAARQLRTDYKTLHVKIKQLGIDARDFGA